MKKLVCKVKDLIQRVKNAYKRRVLLGYYDRVIDKADEMYRQTGQRHFIVLYKDKDLAIVPNYIMVSAKKKSKDSWKQVKENSMYYTEDKKEKCMSKREVALRKVYYVRQIHNIG